MRENIKEILLFLGLMLAGLLALGCEKEDDFETVEPCQYIRGTRHTTDPITLEPVYYVSVDGNEDVALIWHDVTYEQIKMLNKGDCYNALH